MGRNLFVEWSFPAPLPTSQLKLMASEALPRQRSRTTAADCGDRHLHVPGAQAARDQHGVRRKMGELPLQCRFGAHSKEAEDCARLPFDSNLPPTAKRCLSDYRSVEGRARQILCLRLELSTRRANLVLDSLISTGLRLERVSRTGIFFEDWPGAMAEPPPLF